MEGHEVRKKLPAIIGISVLVAVIILAVIFQIRKDTFKFNSSPIIGNTAGNIYNKGLVCEQNGKVYFANPYDRNTLYRMNPDETTIEKVLDVTMELLNVDENHIYYFQTSTSGASGLGHMRSRAGIARCDLDGHNGDSFTSDTAFCMLVVNNELYYLVSNETGPHFYRQPIDGADATLISNELIYPACGVGNTIYYNGRTFDHELYAFDTITSTGQSIWPGNIWNPIVEGDYVYYMDVPNNYRLCRYSLSMGVIEVLTEDRIDMFNMGSGKIFYQKSSPTSPALIRMNYDGSEKEIIAEGVFSDINMTSQYVYFHPFGSDAPMYHNEILGPVNPRPFEAALIATQNTKQ
jgi:hypothetical protein